MAHHVILGAGPAGVIAAETIRKHAPQDRITLVGDEPEPPYSRMASPYLLMGKVGEAGTPKAGGTAAPEPARFRNMTLVALGDASDSTQGGERPPPRSDF